MKDYVYVFDNNGNDIKMEAVMTFKIKELKQNFLIYRTLDAKQYYVAKYDGDNLSILDTELTNEEIKYVKDVFNEVTKWN